MATSIVAQSMSIKNDNTWACSICTYLNQSTKSKCELCITPRSKISPVKKPTKILNISLPTTTISRSRSAPKSHNKKSFRPNPRHTNHTHNNRFKSNLYSKSPQRKAPSTPLDELFEIVPYNNNQHIQTKSINNISKSPKISLPNPIITNIHSNMDSLLSENEKELIIKSPRDNLTSLRNNLALKSNLELDNLVSGEQHIMDDILKDMKKSKPPSKSLPKMKDKNNLISPRKKKRKNSFLGLNRSPNNKPNKTRNRRSNSILIPKKKHEKHSKSRNLSNAFYKRRNKYESMDNQITLTKSKTRKKRLSLHKRASKKSKSNINSKPNPFEFPFPPKPNMITSISVPTESNYNSENSVRKIVSLMEQSVTSPTVANSPWTSPCNSPLANSSETKGGFLSTPSRRTTLYKLPAEKHKLNNKIKKVNMNKLNINGTSNFSFASQVYAELQAVLKTKMPNNRSRNRCSTTLFMHEESIQKHESILLEILKFSNDNSDNDEKKGDNSDSIIDTIINARCDVLCHFLPLIAFTVCQCDVIEWKMKLLNKLRDRIIGQSDLRQAVRFFIKSYFDITCVRAVFAGLCPTGDISNVNNNVSKDAIGFWYNIVTMKDLRDNDYFSIGINTILRDPVRQLSSPIRKVVVRKIINSNSKPLLIDCYAFDKSHTEFLSSTCILKYGDDLRKDKSCMLVFKWINHLFINCKNYKRKLNGIRILTYNVIPMGRIFGCIELITDCIPLRDILQLKVDVFEQTKLFDNLIATAAGSYIASYIMGVRDRHFDNILIRKTDCTLFHIDMNYVLGETITGLDANQFGITKEFYDLLGADNYNRFVDLSCNAFCELRHHYRELINFACFAFSYIYDYNKIRRHVYKQLRMNETDKKSILWLKKELKNAPFNTQTKLKNVVHKFATR